MLLGATSTAANLNDTIVVLIYLAAVVTSLVVLVSRIRAKRKRRRQQKRQPPPGQEAWSRLLAPLASPAIPAPARPPRPGPRSRLDALSATANGSAASVVDLRELKMVPAEVGDMDTGGPPTGAATAPTVETATGRTAGRTIAPARPVLTQPYVTVLGTVDVKGWVSQPDRRIVKELAVYLALHRDRPRSAEELLQALWPARGDDFSKDRDVEAVHQTVSRLRHCLGADAVPDANAAGGYVLAESVQSDWEVFRRLVADVRAGAPAERLAEALSLVSGPPFAGAKKDTYSWVWSELWASKVTAAIVDTAHELANRALLDSDDVWPSGPPVVAWRCHRPRSYSTRTASRPRPMPGTWPAWNGCGWKPGPPSLSKPRRARWVRPASSSAPSSVERAEPNTALPAPRCVGRGAQTPHSPLARRPSPAIRDDDPVCFEDAVDERYGGGWAADSESGLVAAAANPEHRSRSQEPGPAGGELSLFGRRLSQSEG